MLYLAKLLTKSFEKPDTFCYTKCVNTGRNVMATLMNYADNALSFVGKKARKLMLISGVAFAAFSCGDKKDDPSPIGKGVDEFKVEHDTLGINIKISNASSNFFMPRTIEKLDGSLVRGFNVSVKGEDDSYLATGSSSANNTKFTMVINTDNIVYGSNSVENAVNGSKLASKNVNIDVAKYYPAKPNGELADIVEVTTTTKPDGGKLTITKHKHITEASLLAPENGVPLLGASYNKKTFEEFIKNCAANATSFSEKNVMDLVKGSGNASLYSLKK